MGATSALDTFWTVDFGPLAAATMAALACTLVGNVLVLTRRAMAADALSHAIVPGVVVAVVLTGSTAAPVVMAGALVAGLLASATQAFLVSSLRVEPAAALGVTFTSFFALGIIVLEISGLARTAFDIHHVVTGHLEGLVWVHGSAGWPVLDPSALAALPADLSLLAATLFVVATVLAAVRHKLAALAFDRSFAEASGLRVVGLELVLLGTTALACVAAFRSVGVVLAAAMIVCPPATARLFTTRLADQVRLSLVLSFACVMVGYAIAAAGPMLFGAVIALNAAGTIGATAGAMLAAAAALSRPR